MREQMSPAEREELERANEVVRNHRLASKSELNKAEREELIGAIIVLAKVVAEDSGSTLRRPMPQAYLDEWAERDNLIRVGQPPPDPEYPDRVFARCIATMAKISGVEFSFDANRKLERCSTTQMFGNSRDAIEFFTYHFNFVRRWNIGCAFTLNLPTADDMCKFCWWMFCDRTMMYEPEGVIAKAICDFTRERDRLERDPTYQPKKMYTLSGKSR